MSAKIQSDAMSSTLCASGVEKWRLLPWSGGSGAGEPVRRRVWWLRTPAEARTIRVTRRVRIIPCGGQLVRRRSGDDASIFPTVCVLGDSTRSEVVSKVVVRTPVSDPWMGVADGRSVGCSTAGLIRDWLLCVLVAGRIAYFSDLRHRSM